MRQVQTPIETLEQQSRCEFQLSLCGVDSCLWSLCLQRQQIRDQANMAQSVGEPSIEAEWLPLWDTSRPTAHFFILGPPVETGFSIHVQ